MIGIYRFMLLVKTNKLFILVFIIMLVSNFLIGVLNYFFTNNNNSIQTKEIDISVAHIVLAVIIAPLLETALSQRFIIGLSRFYIKNNLICVIISAFIFGLLHYSSILKIFQTMIMGFCLGLFYTVLKKKRANAFFQTATLHSSWNLFAMIITNIANFFS